MAGLSGAAAKAHRIDAPFAATADPGFEYGEYGPVKRQRGDGAVIDGQSRPEAQSIALPFHVGFDRKLGHAASDQGALALAVGDVEGAIGQAPAQHRALTDKAGIDAGEFEASDHRRAVGGDCNGSGDLFEARPAFLDEARDNRPVRPPQTADRDMIADAPPPLRGGQAGDRHGLA
nr:hypothetical protein [Methylocella tundrae]